MKMILTTALLAISLSQAAFAAPSLIGVERALETLSTMNNERVEKVEIKTTSVLNSSMKTAIQYEVQLIDGNDKIFDKDHYTVIVVDGSVQSIQLLD